MEESLESYLQAENECRAQCEGPFDHGWLPDFVPSVSSKWVVAYATMGTKAVACDTTIVISFEIENISILSYFFCGYIIWDILFM